MEITEISPKVLVLFSVACTFRDVFKKADRMHTFYEFFAGGGMARAGLGSHWKCLFANDFDRKKARTYVENWGCDALVVNDVRNIESQDMPLKPDLIWGSFPCQDLSLAGGGAGLKGERSGTFWPFVAHIEALKREQRLPKIICLENVLGTITSHGGKDFEAICQALHRLGFQFGAMIVDAALFLPQSRPRLFFVGIRDDVAVPDNLISEIPLIPWHSKALQNAHHALPKKTAQNWIWWRLPLPSARTQNFIDVVEEHPDSTSWHTPSQTAELLSMMSNVNLSKVEKAKAVGRPMVGAVYKRTRYENGVKVQRAEIRFDNVAGCLRTPAGGSSRQLIMTVHGEKIRSRLISTRETARLMGLPDTYQLPKAYNEAYHLTGDGVAVPVVAHIGKHIFEPLLNAQIVSKYAEAV